MDYRIEHDSMGEVKVPADKLWAAQTQRSHENFEIGVGIETMPREIIHAFGVLKKAAAITNNSLRPEKMTKEKLESIKAACDEIMDGKLNDNFPLVVWQTGSGTQSNMNTNEVIANRGNQILGEKLLHPNDDVNMSQSSNDTFPTAMHIAAVLILENKLIPAVEELVDTFKRLEKENEGIVKSDRTGVGTTSLFGYQMRFNLNEGFPLLTTKRVYLKAIIYELLWFIKGETNIKYLVDNGVRIWNEWPYDAYKKSSDFNGESLEEFVEKIKNDSEFAEKHGNLGPVYGEQWRGFRGPDGIKVDQLQKVINEIRVNPHSRRLIVNAWNPALIDQMALPPCHTLFQFYVNDNKLSCMLYQRSADVFLGVPFNIASYALLTMMVAHICGLELGDFVHTIGDAHLYLNHMEQVELQLSRTPRDLPKMHIKNVRKEITEFEYEDFELTNYNPYKTIKAEVAV